MEYRANNIFGDIVVFACRAQTYFFQRNNYSGQRLKSGLAIILPVFLGIFAATMGMNLVQSGQKGVFELLPFFTAAQAQGKNSEADKSSQLDVPQIPQVPQLKSNDLSRNIKLPPGHTINDYGHPFMVGGLAGTLGIGASVQYGLPDFGIGFNHYALRLGINYFNFNTTQSLGTENSLSVNAKLVTPELLLDLYPSGQSGFHFTVGGMYPIGGVKGTFSSGGVLLAGTKFADIDAYVDIDISSLPLVPYFGVGIKSWSGARANSNNWVGSNIDLGFIWIQPKATGKINCGNCRAFIDIQGRRFDIVNIQNEFNQAVVDKANAFVETIPIYPVLRWTVSVIF